jgi:hypothetical protein
MQPAIESFEAQLLLWGVDLHVEGGMVIAKVTL